MIYWCGEPFGGFSIQSPYCLPVFICLRPFLPESLSAQPSLITEPSDLSFQNLNCTLEPTQIMISLVFNMKSCRLAHLCKGPSICAFPFIGAQAPFFLFPWKVTWVLSDLVSTFIKQY